jgi:hypothetical protein
MAKQNKTRQFEIPRDFIGTFFSSLDQTDLAYELIEITEDEELVIEVEYDEKERDEVMNLIELLDEYYEEVESEE